MKGTKVLEVKIKAKERQKVNSFIPNEVKAKIEAENAKVCDVRLSVIILQPLMLFLSDRIYCAYTHYAH